MINTPANLLKFLNAARNLAKQGLKEKDILAFAKQEFGEVTDLIRLQINKIFKTKNQPSVGIKTKDPVFDNTVETIPFDDTGTPFNPRDPQKIYGKPKVNQNREMTADELENFEMDIGSDNLEAYSFDGTVGDGARILKEQENYMEYMYDQYRTGKLDPVAGDKSQARKKLLQKRFEDMEASGDSRLMTRDEIEELSTFDLGTQMDQMKDIDISQGMIDLDEMNFTKNAQAAKKLLDNASTNKEIKKGVGEIMSDTSPAALEKSIEIDNLMLKYEGMDRRLAEQIAYEINPRKKADIIAMVEQTMEMSAKGMSGDDIIQTFKNTPRTKQANGGIIGLTTNPRPANN